MNKPDISPEATASINADTVNALLSYFADCRFDESHLTPTHLTLALEFAYQHHRKRHLKAVSTSTLRVSKVMSITSSSGEHFDDRDWQCWKPQGAAELRA
ncbi:hypothetical protein [Paraburkholderia domus]|uniref:Uncharacterized protein n=1 Tax=Paraburkholderia domus TaxID=2793075 RepID=A0A9N8MLB0_9BURK|nr:hypothetical protein [Paraburkholderia domus]MBK5164805.1 hypothetical protein [Burkholderia sp. R-70211]CAE6872543.1 hypothetical protein R70211_01370 [Paraburkholderia domus]